MVDKVKLFGLLFILGNVFNVVGSVFNIVYKSTKEIGFEITAWVFLILAVIFIFVFGILWLVQLFKIDDETKKIIKKFKKLK
jgi:preprotein translocase subunit SecY